MDIIESHLVLPIIVYLPDGHRQVLDFTYLYRIQDTVSILNRAIKRWEDFHSDLDSSVLCSVNVKNEIRIQVIESTFIFITFFFLLVGFYEGITKDIRNLLSCLHGDLSVLPPFPEETGTIYRIRTIRNKMVAHSAHVEPRKDDSMDTRLAYLQWYVSYWGASDDTTNRRFNTFGLGDSEHAIPPIFADMVRDAQEYISLCEKCVHKHSNVLTGYLKSHLSDEYAVVGAYSPD